MTIDKIVEWYNKNVNYKLTKAFLNFLVKTGIVKNDINLEQLNSFLLEMYNNELVKENDKFLIKRNRIPVIDKFKDADKITPKNNPITVTKARNKFKIENLGGKRLKLVKV